MVCGLTFCRRAKVRSWLVSAAPRLAADFDRLYGALGFLVVGIFLQDLGAAADDHQKIVEVMGDAAGQLSQRIELLGFGELFLHALQFERGLAPLGDVPRYLGKADKPAVLLDGVDDDARPEERAVLADAPAFFFVTAVLLWLCSSARAGLPLAWSAGV